MEIDDDIIILVVRVVVYFDGLKEDIEVCLFD